MDLVRVAYPEGDFVDEIDSVPPAGGVPEGREAAATEILRGWLESTGPQTATGLADRLALPPEVVSGFPNITPIFMRTWLMKTMEQRERAMLPVSLRSA